MKKLLLIVMALILLSGCSISIPEDITNKNNHIDKDESHHNDSNDGVDQMLMNCGAFLC